MSSQRTILDKIFIPSQGEEVEEEDEEEEDEVEEDDDEEEEDDEEDGGERQEKKREVTPMEEYSMNSQETEDEEDEEGVEVLEEFSNLKDVAGCNWSIYKLDEKRIPGCSGVSEIYEFEKKLENIFSKNDQLEQRVLKEKTSGTFFYMHFVCMSKKKSNYIASKIRRQIGDEKEEDLPGNRKSGNILIYFRMRDSPNPRPEAFFLCEGYAFKHIIHLADPDLRTQATKHFMDGSRIKEITFLNIAGPNVSTTFTCKQPTDILTHRTTYINAYISNILGFIRKHCELYKLVQGDEGEDISMTVGLNVVKIHKKLSYEKIESIVELLSEPKNVDAGDFPTHIIDALDNIQRVTDKDKKSELEKTISKDANNMLTGRDNISDFYLGHRYTKDWSRASDVKLIRKKEKKGTIELACWSSSPSLTEVVITLQKVFSSSGELEEYLNQKQIHLVYQRPECKESHPVQDYIHGYIKRKEGTYFKVENKWFLFSSSLYEVLDRSFSFLSNLLLEQEDIMNIFKFPWYSETKEILASDPIVKNIIGVDKDFSDENLKTMFEILCGEFDLFDVTGSALFTKCSCLLPIASTLTMNKSKASNDKRKGTAGIESNSVGAQSSNSTNNDTTPGTSSDAGRSVLPELVPTKRKKKTNTEDGSDTVQSKLLTIYEKKSRDTKGLPKKISMLIKNKDNNYLVENAVVTNEAIKQIQVIEPSLKDTDIFNFLKSMSKLKENEFNELFLFSNVPDGYFVLPGDKIVPNNVELFDLLIHDGRNRENRITYLFQNKKGLDHHTRDACAQIRNSAELLWHDFMRGKKRHIELFWEMVVESKAASSAYRNFVRERMLTLTKQEFLRMFDDDVQLVFVLAFAPTNKKQNQILKSNLQPITNEMLCENHFDSDIHAALQEKDILNERGYLTDSFIGMTQTKFEGVCVENQHLKKLSKQRRDALHKFLTNYGTCDLSTIAKLELLTLDNCFNTFQIGGGRRRFKLQICYIKS